jgi:hypothetical protein
MEHIVNIVNPQPTEEDAFGCNWDLIALGRAWLCHHKHLDRRNVGQMVVQGATPGRGGTWAGMYLPTVAWLTSMPFEQSTVVRAAVSRTLHPAV